MRDGATHKRDLRTGRSPWPAARVPVRPLTAPIEVDVVIVGAGISGAFMAERLSRTMSVAVIDRRPPLLGSTRASTAILQWEMDLPLTALADRIGEAAAARAYLRARAAIDALAVVVRRERIACGLQAKRSLYLTGKAYGRRALAAETTARAAIGLPSNWLSGPELKARFGIDRTGAITSDAAASIDPVRLAAGLLRRAVARGARLHAPVEALEVLQGEAHVVLVTDAGVEVRARQVVFCCGYEFPKGVPLPGASVASTWAIASKPGQPVPAWMRRHVVWEAADPYLYFRTTPDGRVIAGGEDEASATRHEDARLLGRKAAILARKLAATVPGLAVEPDVVWAGAFGLRTTALPLIGPIPDMPRAHAVIGLGGNGITFSVIASEVVAESLAGAPDPDAGLYAFPT